MSQGPSGFAPLFHAILATLALAALPGCKKDAPANDSDSDTGTATQLEPQNRRVFDATGTSVEVGALSNLVTVGGSVTEITYALGMGDRVRGVDSSSLFPEAATSLPQVGYQRRLSAEGVLALGPDLILVTEESGPPPAIAQLRASGVPMVVVPVKHSVESAKAAIRVVGDALDRSARAEALVATLERELAEARALQPKGDAKRPRVLFIYARGQGTLNVAGTDTSGDAMIALAGGENAITGFEGYKALTAEAVVEAAPDFILMSTKGAESVGGTEGVFALPGLALTPAGKGKRLVTVDDLLLLGFGPRTGAAAKALSLALHGGAAEATEGPHKDLDTDLKDAAGSATP